MSRALYRADRAEHKEQQRSLAPDVVHLPAKRKKIDKPFCVMGSFAFGREQKCRCFATRIEAEKFVAKRQRALGYRLFRHWIEEAKTQPSG